MPLSTSGFEYINAVLAARWGIKTGSSMEALRVSKRCSHALSHSCRPRLLLSGLQWIFGCVVVSHCRLVLISPQRLSLMTKLHLSLITLQSNSILDPRTLSLCHPFYVSSLIFHLTPCFNFLPLSSLWSQTITALYFSLTMYTKTIIRHQGLYIYSYTPHITTTFPSSPHPLPPQYYKVASLSTMHFSLFFFFLSIFLPSGGLKIPRLWEPAGL